ncbi:MAG: hypothetical protein OEZ59_02850 [Deltaproteobacteria bacterium]|nr:hypothetical protein [Deltaproteobacteria bacterium]
MLPHQQEVFDSETRHVVYVKGRRAGGTLGAVLRLRQLAWEKAGSRHLWVDTALRNIEKYWRRYFLPHLKGFPYRLAVSSRVVTFANGSVLEFGSGQRPETLEGMGYDYIWVNEAGILLRNEKLYYETLLPMALDSPACQFFFIGAPKGRGLFQRMYERGQDDSQADWTSFRHPSSVNPAVNREELERQREHMPERVYRQEILAEFIDEEGCVFRRLDEIPRAGPEESGCPGAPYVIGVDLARHTDYTVAWVGRADRLACVACERFRQLPWKQQAERIAGLSRRFGGASVLADATGVGDPVCEDLMQMGVPVQPVVFTALRKRQLIDHLALLMEKGRLSMIPHEETMSELSGFRYETLPTGHVRCGAPAGGHDDCVIALALCCWGMAAQTGGFILGTEMASLDFHY